MIIEWATADQVALIASQGIGRLTMKLINTSIFAYMLSNIVKVLMSSAVQWYVLEMNTGTPCLRVIRQERLRMHLCPNIPLLLLLRCLLSFLRLHLVKRLLLFRQSPPPASQLLGHFCNRALHACS
jgi:hypothetical protein